jgi:hypothetical protein
MASKSFFLSRNLMIALLGVGLSPATAAPVCKPVIGFKEVRFSPTDRETMERMWSATLSVDASRCLTTSGRFEILFSRLKENATEIEFSEPFVWKPGSMEVSVNFWADEAVESYWLHSIAACPCRD